MEPMQLIVNGLLLALLVTTLLWWRLYRRLKPNLPQRGRDYRLHQVLIGTIATLTILIAVLIVLSSDPGNPDDFQFWP